MPIENTPEQPPTEEGGGEVKKKISGRGSGPRPWCCRMSGRLTRPKITPKSYTHQQPKQKPLKT